MQSSQQHNLVDKHLSTIDALIASIDPDDSEESIWEEKPVSPFDFIKKKDFYGDVRGFVWPCIIEDLEIIFSGENYEPACNVFYDSEGIGAGKSTKVALIFAYLVYRLHCLKDPFRYFELVESTLAFMNMSPRGDQAKAVVFDKVKKAINRTRWFRDKGYLPDPRIQSVLRFPKKSIDIVPGNSSEKFPLGADLYGGVIDEAQFFITQDNRDNCGEIFEALNERRKSRFDDKGLIVLVSSANLETTFMEKEMTVIERYRQEAGITDDIIEHDDLKVYCRRRPVWEAKPKSKYSGRTFSYTVTRDTLDGNVITYDLNVPIEYKRQFHRNPGRALKNLASIPALTIDPYIKDWDRVLAHINKEREDPCPDLGDDVPESPSELYRRLPDWFFGDSKTTYYAHIDLATGGEQGTGDACGLAVGHRGPDKEINGEILPTGFLDLSVRFKGAFGKKIKFTEVRRFLVDLHHNRGFRFGKITFDGWQSEDSIQILTDKGYEVEKHGADKASYDTMLDLILDNRLDYFHDIHLLKELKRLEDKGKSVEKSLGSSDDESDSVARVCALIVEGIIGTANAPQKRAKRGALVRKLTSKNPAMIQQLQRRL